MDSRDTVYVTKRLEPKPNPWNTPVWRLEDGLAMVTEVGRKPVKSMSPNSNLAEGG